MTVTRSNGNSAFKPITRDELTDIGTRYYQALKKLEYLRMQNLATLESGQRVQFDIECDAAEMAVQAYKNSYDNALANYVLRSREKEPEK